MIHSLSVLSVFHLFHLCSRGVSMFDVIGIGYTATDYLGIVPRYAEIDTKMEMSPFIKQGGGPAATAMVAVSRLGGRASYVGKVGDDDFGRFMLDQLAVEGVDTSQVTVAPGAESQFAFIVVDGETGKRTIYWTRSGVPSLRPDELDREHVLSAKVLLVDGHDIEAAIEAAGWANEAGIPVVYDAGTARENTDVLFERTNYLAASKLFATSFTGEDDPEKAASAMFGGRRKLSAVTLGSEGCFYATSEGTAYQPAFQVDTVDTTGAGDVFHGAMAFAVFKDWPIPEMVEFASAVAAMKCTALGGRTAIPSLPQALGFLRERSPNGFWSSQAHSS